MNQLLASTAFVALMPLTMANASETLNDNLLKCAKINRDMHRLACFDLLVSRKQPSAEVIIIDKKTIKVIEVTQQQPKTVVKTKASTDTFGLASPPTPPSSADFGLKEVSNASDSLHSNIPGDFRGWKKGDKIKLANGQIWKIKDSTSLHHKASSPSITISRGMFDSFRIGIDGINRTARVVRIK